MLKILKFLVSVITIYLTIQELVLVMHIITFTDISSGIGWMLKTYFDTIKEYLHDKIKIWLDWKLIKSETPLYYQKMHIKYNIWFTIKGLSYVKENPNTNYQISPDSIYQWFLSQNNTTQINYIMNIFTNKIHNKPKGISKAIVDKKYGNWKR